jgi:hypothetical protein
MSSVVSLFKGTPIVSPGTPNPELISDLEKLLEKAKSGEITSIAYAALYSDDLTSYHWVGKMTRSMIGSLELIKYALCRGDWEDDK